MLICFLTVYIVILKGGVENVFLIIFLIKLKMFVKMITEDVSKNIFC